MKKFLFTLLVLCYAMTGKAQNEMLSAILQTGDQVTMYTGTAAFSNAYNNATDGSIITLSPGLFDMPKYIQKSIIVYGAGWEEDSENGTTHITTLNGGTEFKTTDGSTLQNIRLEGLYIKGSIVVNMIKGMIIDKCWINGDFNYSYREQIEDVTIRRSCIWGNISSQMGKITNLTVNNCYICGRYAPAGNDTQVMFDHCIFNNNGYSSATGYYSNCILNLSSVGAASTLKNCICTFAEPTNVSLKENCWFGTGANIFSDVATYDYSATRTFELNDPDTYSGTDETPIGVTGGNFPWNKVPAIPVVTSLGLTVDGQNLNVTYDANVR